MRRQKSEIEETMALHLRADKIDNGMEREYKFHPTRKWRFDFAWPKLKIALEIEGVVWGDAKGRHQTALGIAKDCEKYNEATRMGWDVYRFTGAQVKSGGAILFLKNVLDNVDA